MMLRFQRTFGGLENNKGRLRPTNMKIKLPPKSNCDVDIR